MSSSAQHRTVDHIIDVPMPHVVEETGEVVQTVRHGDIMQSIVDQIVVETFVDGTVAQTHEHIVEVVPDIPQVRVQWHTLERSVDVSMPQIVDESCYISKDTILVRQLEEEALERY